ncbi:hypothetical protein ACFFJ7_05745 [Pseudochelatococcus lubricantis]|uniref:hypothetical protein n=1 Tax=Pseudochelatococcus lubricantis TaxID=1538102 RepID=UPI0035E7F4AD
MTKRIKSRDEAQFHVSVNDVEHRRNVGRALTLFKALRDSAIDLGRGRREAITAAAAAVTRMFPGVNLLSALGVEPKDPPDGVERPEAGDFGNVVFPDLIAPEPGPSGENFDPAASDAFMDLVRIIDGLLAADLGPVLIPGFAGGGEVATVDCEPVVAAHAASRGWSVRADAQNIAATFAVRLAAGLPLGTRRSGEEPNVADRPLRIVIWTPWGADGLRKAIGGARWAGRIGGGELLALAGDHGHGVTLDEAYKIADDGHDALIVAHASVEDAISLEGPGRVAVVAVGGALCYTGSGAWLFADTKYADRRADARLSFFVFRGDEDDIVEADFIVHACGTGSGSHIPELHWGVTMEPPAHRDAARAV